MFIGSRRDPMMDHSVAGMLPHRSTSRGRCADRDSEASLLKAGVIIVFPDYRLLDPSSGWDELQDVKALVSFLNSSAFESSLPHGIQIDYGRFAVGGFSAGGYMTRLLIRELLEAFEKGTSKIQTVACLSYFGMGGDYLLDQWVLKNLTCLTARKPDHLVNGTVLPEIADCPYTPSLPGYAETTAIRDPFCPYYWSTGALHDLTTGEAGFSRKLRSVPHRDREALVATLEAAPLFPQVFLATSALARQWPETLLAHGSGDFVVPHAESLHTFDQLRKLNVAVTLFTVPNGDHDLNDVDTGKAIPQRLEAYQATIDFLLRKLID